MELYNKRYDWLISGALVLVPVWIFYAFEAAFIAVIAFLLIGALKPLRTWLGTSLRAGIWAAGLLLLLSPLLRFAFYNGYCYDAVWSVAAGISRYQIPNLCDPGLFDHVRHGIWKGPLRDVGLPALGLAILAFSTAAKEPTEPPSASEPGKRCSSRKYMFLLLLPATLTLILSGINYRTVLAEREARRVEEIADQLVAKRAAANEAKRIAAEKAAKRVDHAWLIGTWVGLNYKELSTAKKSQYCATDYFIRFKSDSTYERYYEDGRFSIKNDFLHMTRRRKLPDLTEDPAGRPILLDDKSFLIERSDKYLKLDGNFFGRC